MTKKKETGKQPAPSQESNSLDPRAIQILLEGIDLANKRGAYSIQESGRFAEAYMHVAKVLTDISKFTQEQQGMQQQMNNITGEND